MPRLGGSYRVCLVALALLFVLVWSVAEAAGLAFDDPATLLKQADDLRTSNYAESVAIVQRLGDGKFVLSSEQHEYLLYLQAWQIAYRGDFAKAIPLLNKVDAEAADPNLRFRANITAVNVLGIERQYEMAFSRLAKLLNQLPLVTDDVARLQGLVVAAQLYSAAGQYDLATTYADRLLREVPTKEGLCKGSYLKLEALYRRGAESLGDKQFKSGIDACIDAGDTLWVNGIRANMAAFQLQRGDVGTALKELRENQADVVRSRYAPLIARFNVLIAKGYWKQGNAALARQFALAAVSSDVKDDSTESMVMAYQILYEVSKKQADMAAALGYHEKYMKAATGYLNEVSAKALAYQTVKQQVLAKKLQIDSLAKQNRILQLQQALSKKAVEASRLWIVLLLLLLGFIGFITYRIKRSQLRFMKLARRDGLTGIFNRQHFVSEAERQLQYCRKSLRDACLVLIDLDHFKAVNDTHGHAVGDRVLKRAVAACQAHLRSTDVFGRLGGEEFGIILPECALDQVLARVEQMRMAIATVSAGEEVPDIPISASFGVASVTNSGYELRQLMIDADDALYRAKREGRNRVSLSESRRAHLSVV